MKIAIVGAGIVGVTTAWELTNDGHEVVVFERRNAAAEEASFATAGIFGPGYITPWAAPGMRAKMLWSLLAKHSAIKLRWPMRHRELHWMAHWQRACRLEAYLAHRTRLQRLASFSQLRLHQIAQTCDLTYEHSQGCLVLLRSKRECKLVEPYLELLSTNGIAFNTIDAQEAHAIEPALHPKTHIAGAIHLPDDEVGNCRQFAMLLKQHAERLGAQFHFGCDIAPLNPAQPRALSLTQGSPSHVFDAIVICAGFASADLLQPLGLHIPLVPVRGHSISAPLRDPELGPRSAVVDERFGVSLTRLGQRVRITGGGEIGGADESIHPRTLRTLHKVLHDWFPGAISPASTTQQWTGMRPMLPDGPPIIGASGIPGVWLNLGHGSSGWALSCGSARVMADLIGGFDPGIDLHGLGIERLLNAR